MSVFTTTPIAICVAVVLALYGFHQRGRRNRLPLPPGPPKLPFVGNMFNIPTVRPWEAYSAWSKEYNSDILHLDVAGTSIVVLSSVEATNALLEKRSALYSDRPRLPMVVELMGWGFAVGLMRYGDEWRTHRRLFGQAFTPKACINYRPKQLSAAHELLRRCLRQPEDFRDHLHHWAADIIMRVAYGIDVLPVDDPWVSLARAAVRPLGSAGVAGKYFVDSFPILKYVPSWFPGAGFKRDAKKWKKLSTQFADVPFAETKRQMELGIAPPSFAADGLNALNDNYYTENTVRAMTGTIYIGGADTAVSGLESFILGMLANPEAQRKAQAEVDAVTKGTRLPDFEDEASMPYVTSVMKEALRWKITMPLAIAHYLNVPDVFRGYSIPANSVVLGNSWAILHNEDVYPDPEAFKPERFLLDGHLNPAVPDPDAAFGFGRRLCPGRHMATASLWSCIASILATFDITKALDEQGHEIEPSYEFESGFINSAAPFKCVIRPRSRAAEALVRGTENSV
ncbi:cytochrome P450 [Mycena filopes]|nr:cytochrome P450 [Mycena filopes]